MGLLRATSLILLVAISITLMGCGGSSESVVFRNISERGAWGPNNVLAFTTFGGNMQRYIYRCNQAGGGQVLLTKSNNDLVVTDEGGWHPDISPAGNRIAFAARRNGGSASIYLMDATLGDGQFLQRLTDSSVSGQDGQPNWSPDGTRIVFTTDKVIGGQGTGGPDIAMINSDGSGLVYLVATIADEQWPVFSPDGTRVAYQVGPAEGPRDIHILDLTTGTTANVTAGLRTGPADTTRFECPEWGLVGNEEWIYVHSNRDGDFDIFRFRPDGSGLQQITNDSRSDGYPVLSPTGRQLLFTRDRELWSRDATPGGTEKRLTRKY